MISPISERMPAFRFVGLSSFPEIDHAVFTRRGGCSSHPYKSLNTAFGIGDDPAAVSKNRRLIADRLGCASDRLIFTRQVHGTGVRIIKETGIPERATEADALVTNRRGIYLAIQVADCQPVLIYDPSRQVIAAVHSGWRGSVANILGKTVAVMQSRFGSRAETLIAGIGPSLGPCCAEFIHYRKEIPRDLWGYKKAGDRFDFWAISRDQLVRAGMAADRIEIAGLCTRCRTDLFFSYRSEGRTGRFAAVFGLLHGGKKAP